MKIERACADDVEAIASVLRQSMDAALPFLPKLHTPDEDVAFMREHLLPSNQVFVARDVADRVIGYIAFDETWVNHLYLLPDATKKGLGTRLLEIAKSERAYLQLWCFQRNENARRFYSKQGFVLVRETDGAENEEKEPDALYEWRRV